MLQALAAKRLREIRAEQAKAGTSPAAFVAKYANDYAGFCRQLEILPRSGPRTPLVLSTLQARYAAVRTPRDIILKPRQVGITTEEQARDIWFLLANPGSRVVVVCQSITGNAPTNELAGRFEIMFESLRRGGLNLNFRSETKTSWVLADTDAKLTIIEAGASQAAAQKKGRAGTITRLHLTETAFWEYAGETLTAMLECVPGPEHGSEIVFESTANGVGGDDRANQKGAAGASVFSWAYHDAKARLSGYKAHFIKWLDEPGYRTALEPGESIEPANDRERRAVAAGASPEQLKWLRQKVAEKSADQVDQEYPSDDETCWLVEGRTFFDRDVTQKLFGLKREPLRIERLSFNGSAGDLRVFAEPVQGAQYVAAVDTSEGSGGDRGGIIVYQRGTGAHVATVSGQFKPWDLARAAAEVGRLYNLANVVVERNNHGHACLRALDAEQKYPRVYQGTDEKPGWLTSAVSRTAALDAFEQAHRSGAWASADSNVLAEVRTFVVKNGKPQAASGANDDLVMAAAIGWDVVTKTVAQIRPPRPSGKNSRFADNSRGY